MRPLILPCTHIQTHLAYVFPGIFGLAPAAPALVELPTPSATQAMDGLQEVQQPEHPQEPSLQSFGAQIAAANQHSDSVLPMLAAAALAHTEEVAELDATINEEADSLGATRSATMTELCDDQDCHGQGIGCVVSTARAL